MKGRTEALDIKAQVGESGTRVCGPGAAPVADRRPAIADRDPDRCPNCGARITRSAPDELLTLEQIMERYGVKRTKALALRREVRRRFPDAMRSNGRCVRVSASALDRVWERG
jgi:hypothetical protein